MIGVPGATLDFNAFKCLIFHLYLVFDKKKNKLGSRGKFRGISLINVYNMFQYKL